MDVSIPVRLAALRRRHRIRQGRAEAAYDASRNPEHGWPVADYRAVWEFMRHLVRGRRQRFMAMVLLNALAAGAAMLVPRLLGTLVDDTTTGSADPGGTVRMLVLVVLAQGILTFWGQRTSRSSVRTCCRSPGSTSSTPSWVCRWVASRVRAPATWSPGSPGTWAP